jgi:hypothetical protein
MKISLTEIRQAVARGWTYPANSKKVMDTELAESISKEIQKLLESKKQEVITDENGNPPG